MTGFSTAFASKCLIYLVALAYRALLTDVCCWRGWRNGYQWVLGALLIGIFGLIGSAFGASCWWFLFSTLGGVVVSGWIICTLFSNCFVGCGVKLSRSVVAVMGGIFTLGNFGATLGGGPGGCFDDSVGTSCCGWTVACWKFSPTWSNACICASPMCAYGAAGAGFAEGMDQFCCRYGCIFSWGLKWNLKIVREKLNCVWLYYCSCFWKCICCNSGNDPWYDLCTIHLDFWVPNFFWFFAWYERLPLLLTV